MNLNNKTVFIETKIEQIALCDLELVEEKFYSQDIELDSSNLLELFKEIYIWFIKKNITTLYKDNIVNYINFCINSIEDQNQIVDYNLFLSKLIYFKNTKILSDSEILKIKENIINKLCLQKTLTKSFQFQNIS